MITWCTTGLLFTWPKRGSCWPCPPPTPAPQSPSYIETKEKSHLKTLRLWCELCVVVCPCFLDDLGERGPYLNTRWNKKTLCNQTSWSAVCHRRRFPQERLVISWICTSVWCEEGFSHIGSVNVAYDLGATDTLWSVWMNSHDSHFI